MKFFLLMFCVITVCSNAAAQPTQYSVANAHAHNDYNQLRPFYQAYEKKFGSMEADIHLRNGVLVVGHDSDKLVMANTLEKLYLDPIVQALQQNGGFIYGDRSRQLQLLVDLKTEPITTLNRLIRVLLQYPSIIQNETIKIVITGNRPPEESFMEYPAFILFDCDAGKSHSKKALTKIAMLSENFEDHSQWDGNAAMPDSAKRVITAMIKQAHQLRKPIRFYACPDTPNAWQIMKGLKVDYINTDHIEALAAWLQAK